MNIVIINGSQRKNGNCERFSLVAKEILEGKHSVDVFNLIDMDIKYCSGCLCCEDGEECLLCDDYSNILEPRLINADLIILCTPAYFNMPSAALVNFIDRTNKICNFFAENKKRCLFYLVGQTDKETIRQAYNCLYSYAEIMNFEEIAEPIINVARMPEPIEKEIIEILKKI